MIDKVREKALKILYKIEEEKAYSNIALDEEIKQSNLDKRDIGLISQIVYGVTSWKLTLDEIIKKYSKIKLKKISPWILNIIRMGIYQIIFLDKIPKSAAVNESVNLAKRYGHKSSSNFVNAILRKVNKKDYEELFNIEDNIERISKVYSMPTWIIEELSDENTIEEIEEICKASNIRPKISIRVNKLKITREELKNKLEEKELIVEYGLLENFLIVSNIKEIEKIQEFKEGLFTVQDEAAGLTAIALDPKPGEIILDACSSPGGKTTYIAELANDNAKIEAWDIHEHRVKLVEEATKRLQIKNIQVNVQDATIEKEEYYEKFDKILLDVPCLGIGVLRRKPDIKWQRKREDIGKIVEIQEKILQNCSKYLKHGGALIYSTCSIIKDENKDIVEKFIKNNSEFGFEEIKIKNEILKNSKTPENPKYIQIYQNENTDGFFICKISKK